MLFEFHQDTTKADSNVAMQYIQSALATHKVLAAIDPMYNMPAHSDADEERVFGPLGITCYISSDVQYSPEYLWRLYADKCIMVVGDQDCEASRSNFSIDCLVEVLNWDPYVPVQAHSKSLSTTKLFPTYSFLTLT